MILQIDKSFEKDTDKVKDSKLKLKIAACINQVIESKTVLKFKTLKTNRFSDLLPDTHWRLQSVFAYCK